MASNSKYSHGIDNINVSPLSIDWFTINGITSSSVGFVQGYL